MFILKNLKKRQDFKMKILSMNRQVTKRSFRLAILTNYFFDQPIKISKTY